MVLVHGIAIFIHVIIIIFKLVIIPVPARPTFLTAAKCKQTHRSINALLAWCTSGEAGLATLGSGRHPH